MKFNAKKCKVLHLGYSNRKLKYYMEENDVSKELDETTVERDLGVLFSNDLKPSQQCVRAASKANRVLRMIKRSFTRLNEQTLRTLYFSYVRPQMEFCIQAWSPYYQKDIETLEKVQRRATKLIPRLKYLSYDERLRILGITRLEQRRLRGDLIETYKLVTHKEKVHPDIFFQRNLNTQLRGHPSKISQKQLRLLVRSNFFSQRIVKFWNNLPEHVAEAPSLGAFKKRRDELWKDMTWDEIQAYRRSNSHQPTK